MKNSLQIYLTLLLGTALTAPLAQAKATYVGVLGFVTSEITDEHGKYIANGEDACLFPLFEKNETGWKTVKKSFDTGGTYRPLPLLDWWIFFDGKSRQKLNTELRMVGPKVHNPQYERNCLDEKRNKQPLQLLESRNKAALNVLATTSETVNDPEHWTRTNPPADELRKAKEAFIKKFEFDRNCHIDEKDPPWGTIEITKRKLKPESIALDPRSFRSNTGSFLIGLRTRAQRCLTDTQSINAFYQKHWYFVSNGTAKEVGSSDGPLSLEPIDAGDLDGDGKVEWIFRQNSINAGSIGSEFLFFDPNFTELARGSIYLKAVESDE